ncbi:DUF2254 domain-containing protein [Roseibaca sp. Y0-43]|uniref:DUF2254 domain-containing protein n=1 Tax=Roseibaca sp. Y0-43 TaxID=2816854 RepID=UPI001D0C6FA6|nr:DUF2254 domain-containing protein [Roseibaca sp. Y0-43]MCC1480135.1 DUF2254 domain-containing protein [Roseibaca sp. Y0-43]
MHIWSWHLGRFFDKIWVHIALYGLAGVAVAVLAAFGAPLVSLLQFDLISRDAVMVLLQILASSMLAVTTFSVSIMLTAFGAAASSATPRATVLLQNDSTTQQVLASFVGAFVFSLVSISGLQIALYGPAGRLVLFLATLGVLALVVVQLVRWIGHLADYGRLADTITRLETATAQALNTRMSDPFMGGTPLPDTLAQSAPGPGRVTGTVTGYIQTVDMAALQSIATRLGTQIALRVLPGKYVHPGMVLAEAIRSLPLAEQDCEAIRACFVIGAMRNFEQDPRFGILSMSEIASRALSPAVNDPGTAIDILGRQVRLLCLWQPDAQSDRRFSEVLVPSLMLADLLQDAFAAPARDGAALVEIGLIVQKRLAGLMIAKGQAFHAPALAMSRHALAHARQALVLEQDRESVSEAAERLRALAETPEDAAH